VVHHVDPRALLPRTPWVDRWTWHVGGQWFGLLLQRQLAAVLADKTFDICHVDGGEWVTPNVVKTLREHARWVVNYNIDDPTGPRDGPRFKAYRQAAMHYDLLVVVRNENIPELEALGATSVLRVYRSADEVNHAPRNLTSEDHAQWDTEVLFLGTWFPERGPFLKDLIQRGVPLTIRGPHWQKAPEWPALKAHWAGGAVGGDNYAKALQCAKVNLGLLSKDNRDQHTTRSLEIPALGALLCAERTPEHTQMYEEGHEALFWSDAASCADACQLALGDDSLRRTIAQAGHQRYLENGWQNETVMRSIIDALEAGA
jgi:spore maturation protein CgeB